jgi:hypothetical protein
MKLRVAVAWSLVLIFSFLFRTPAGTGETRNPYGGGEPMIVAQFNTRADSADTNRPFARNRTADSTAVKDTSKTIVKRDFVHREQVVVGSTIMLFCIFILVSMANWNPQ